MGFGEERHMILSGTPPLLRMMIRLNGPSAYVKAMAKRFPYCLNILPWLSLCTMATWSHAIRVCPRRPFLSNLLKNWSAVLSTVEQTDYSINRRSVPGNAMAMTTSGFVLLCRPNFYHGFLRIG